MNNLKVKDFEVNWDSLKIFPDPKDKNVIEINLNLKSLNAIVDVFT